MSIFIVGMPRSGTTLLSMLLSSHSRIAIAPETKYFRDFWCKEETWHQQRNSEPFDDWARHVVRTLSGKVFDWSESEQEQVVKNVLDGAARSQAATLENMLQHYARKLNKDIWGEKTPGHWKYIDQIIDMFPSGKIIHIVRDPRAVAVSMSRTSWVQNRALGVARRWRDCMRATCHGSVKWPGKYYEIKYEDLLDHPGEILENLCRFAGVEYEERMLDPSCADPTFDPQREPWKKNALNPIDSRNAMRWQGEIRGRVRWAVESIAGAEMQAKGYCLGGRLPRQWISPMTVLASHVDDRIGRYLYGARAAVRRRSNTNRK